MARTREQLAERAAQDIPEGWYVNLGIGMPTGIADYVPLDREVVFHSENGVLGMGPKPPEDQRDPWLINAGKQHVTLRKGGSIVHHADSFAMIRGGHLDLCVLGAFEVAENGDIANWMIPGKLVKGMGGAMDLVAGTKRIVVLTDHVAKDGSAKIVNECTLPLTGLKVVQRIITDLAAFDVTPDGLVLTQLAPDVTVEQVRESTEPAFTNAL